MCPTQILDLTHDPPEARLSRRSIMNSVIVLIGMIVPTFIRNPAFNHWLWLPAIYVGIVVHELGHVVSAQFAGIQAGGIGVGGLTIFKSGRRWRFGFEFARLFGGVFIPLPARSVSRPAQYGWMVAGGPLATVLFAAIVEIAVLRFGGGDLGWRSSLIWADLMLLALVLLPERSSDAANLFLLWRDPIQSRSRIAMLQIRAENVAGVQPRAWNPWIFEEMLRISPSMPEYFYCQLLAFCRRRDEGKTQEALGHLESALSASAESSNALRQLCFVEAACACALVHKNIEAARTWLQRAQHLHKPESNDLAEAAIAVCERRYDDALRLYGSARDRLVRARLDSGIARFEVRKIVEYLRKCEAALGRNARAVGRSA